MLLIPPKGFDAHPMLADLGFEPMGAELSAEALAPRFAKRAAPLKAILSDQRVIAGLGNIYVCEALWRARLSPKRAAGTLVRADGTPDGALGQANRCRARGDRRRGRGRRLVAS
jgi:Formamidopyrimidine-DNA glycosylase